MSSSIGTINGQAIGAMTPAMTLASEPKNEAQQPSKLGDDENLIILLI
jgi:hypothetical protein